MTIYSDRIIPQGKIFLCYSIGIARNIQFYIPLSIHNLSDAVDFCNNSRFSSYKRQKIEKMPA